MLTNNLTHSLTIDEEEKRLEEEDDTEITLPPKNIYTINEVRSCADIHRLCTKGRLNQAPAFQREEVWSLPQKTRFIDSLVKELPIPSMCFSQDSQTKKFEVIDGRQRISTILKFLSDDDWRLSRLDDIDPRISGKTVREIKEEQLDLYSGVEDLSIPITIINCDLTREDNVSYIFKIFHRLNTGGMKLVNQEIRNCIFAGTFNQLLADCNQHPLWKAWVPSIANNVRQKGNERILNFFTFFYDSDKYTTSKLSSFLNGFMDKHKHLSESEKEQFNTLFEETLQIAARLDLTKMGKLKNVYVDAVMYGIAKNRLICENASAEALQQCFSTMLETGAFKSERLQSDLANHDSLKKRLDAAESCFKKVN